MRPPRRTAVLALAAAALLAAAGCGGPADAEGDGPRGGTLRIGAIGTGNKLTGPVGYLLAGGGLVPLLGGLGVTAVQVVTFPNGPDLNQALAAGELDLATYGDTPALVARGAGQPTRLVAQSQVNLDAGILARKGGGPTSLAGLVGKKVAVQTGSYIHRYLLGALADARVTPARIVHVYSTDVEAALERGDVDAAAVPAANVELLRAGGYPLLDTAARDHPRYRGTSATVVTEKYLAARPAVVAAWQAVHRAAHERARGDWPGFLAYTTSINGFPPAVVAASTRPEQWAAEPFTPAGLALLGGTKEFLAGQKFLKKDFTIDAWLAPGAR
ncbi:hypothetical protein GCM10010123_07120 [Pilimelia anulata]|uniref:SsuA/THI5-like domain-containing protein n=1 Tax=Pilimelia anulata TaxID=53371 RepID=A0A8J3FB26_9ACTN|nr:ABC transporter substrate-binding protein [Pilimelia anulata]GGJ79859.1 hypothetical protein GCM10010123_07120 [Pilimelia anulata]